MAHSSKTTWIVFADVEISADACANAMHAWGRAAVRLAKAMDTRRDKTAHKANQARKRRRGWR